MQTEGKKFVDYAVQLAQAGASDSSPERIWGRVDQVSKQEFNEWVQDQPEGSMPAGPERFAAAVKRLAGESGGEGADEGEGGNPAFDEALRGISENNNPSMPQIQKVLALGTPKQKAALERATRNAFGGGIPWHWALENEGLLKRDA